MKKCIVCSLVLLCHGSLFGNSISAESDSLISLLDEAIDDNKCEIYLSLLKENVDTNDSLFNLYLDQVVQCDNCTTPQTGAIRYYQARQSANQNEYDKSIERAKEAILLMQNSSEMMEQEIGKSHLLIGHTMRYLGKYDQSIKYLHLSLDQFKKSKYKSGIASSYNNIGIAHHEIKEYTKAEEFYMLANDIYAELGRSDQQVYTYNNIGSILLEKEEYPKAIENFHKALALAQQSNFEFMEIFVLANLSSALNSNKQFKLAHEYADIGISKARGEKHKRLLSYLLITKSEIEYDENNTCTQMDGLLAAHEFGLKSNELNLITSSAEALERCYALKGDYENSYEYLKLVKMYTDSMHNTVLIERTSKLAREYERKELESKKELDKASRNLLMTGLTLLSLLLLCSVFFSQQLFKKNKLLKSKNSLLQDKEIELNTNRKSLEHNNQKLKVYIESNTELQEFAWKASHDLKSPLRTIGSYVSLLNKKLVNKLQPEEHQYMNYVNGGVQRMYDLIDDLLKLSEIKNIDLNIDKIESKLFFENIIADLAYAKHQENADIKLENIPEYFYGDKIKVRRVIQNLLENAFKYRKPDVDPIIKISAKQIDRFIEFSVLDNGKGIKETMIDDVFKSFSRMDTTIEGTGLGLSICKNIIEKHGGKIWVKSIFGMGSEFAFTLPNKDLLTDDQIKTAT